VCKGASRSVESYLARMRLSRLGRVFLLLNESASLITLKITDICQIDLLYSVVALLLLLRVPPVCHIFNRTSLSVTDHDRKEALDEESR